MKKMSAHALLINLAKMMPHAIILVLQITNVPVSLDLLVKTVKRMCIHASFTNHVRIRVFVSEMG